MRSAIWLPVWVLQLGITRVQGFRQVPRVTRSWNRRSSRRHLLGQSEQPPTSCQLTLGGHMYDLVSPTRKCETVSARVERYRSVTTDAAKQRHTASLTQLGVQLPLRASSETSQLTYSPLWCAFLRKGSQERLVAIGGVSGKEADPH